MIAISQTIFMLALLFTAPVYVMYFTALHYFGRALQQAHPEIYHQASSPTGLNRSYAALQMLQKDRQLLASLAPTVQAQFRSTYRYLVMGMSGFMVMLFPVLAGALIAGKT